MQFIDLKSQYLRVESDVKHRINAVLDHGKYILGPELTELEGKLTAYVGTQYAFGMASGTDALLVALMAIGIKAGDEIITTPFSFIGSSEVIALLGAKPVFVDINPDTYNIDPTLIEGAISNKTKAILAVDIFGQCADYDAINAIAKKYKLPVIQDAAQSFGATYKGQKSCSQATISCTSFFPSKPLGCYGDGGACFTNDEQLATAIKQIRTHGSERRYYHTRIGVNGRLDTIQAAVLLAKLQIFDEEVLARQRVADYYNQALHKHYKIQHVEEHNHCVYAQYTIEVERRAAVLEQFKQANIPTAVHYPLTLNCQPVFSYLNQPKGSFYHAETAAERVMSLPMHPYLEASQIDNIVSCLIRSNEPIAERV